MWWNADVIKSAERFSAFFVLLVMLAACAPTARYFNVDVKDRDAVNLPLENRPVAVLSVVGQNKTDSARVGNVAIGLAEKIEEDRALEKGDVAVYSIPKVEFEVAFGDNPGENGGTEDIDVNYIQSLMIESGAHVFVFVGDLRFGQYTTQKSAVVGDYDNVNILIPYSVNMGVYDAISNKVLLKQPERDTLYLQVLSSAVAEGKVGSVIAGYIPQMAQRIGIKLGTYLSQQWETQERMIISFEGESAWEAPYLLAQDFQWAEAIERWMKLAQNENPKRAAYAAYNVAVGCEMMEQFDLAIKWIEYSMKKYKFQEALDLYNHLLAIKK